MPVIINYFFKLSVSLAVVFLFYQFVLRRLTFYNWNRWYLLGYTLLSFFIPLINITPVLEANELQNNTVISWVPVWQKENVVTALPKQEWHLSAWDIVYFLFAAGVLVMLIRFLVQYISYRRIKAKATMIAVNNLQVYQVKENIIPFSFGNAIFINPALHTSHELEEIVRHEFVHVKQKHSLDILWAEFICIINWYNPFAWWLKKSVRQNLEFIADHNVIENGADKKQYQYLLLKVIGNSQFSIAPQFNFTSLKKRIAMMNKIKSAKVHLVKFLFILPMVSVLLLAFRNIEHKKNAGTTNKAAFENKKVVVAGLVLDAVTMQPLKDVSIFCKKANTTVTTDENGYYKLYVPFENEELQFQMLISKNGYNGMTQTEHWGNFYIDGIYQSYGHTIELFALNKKGEGYSTIAGNARTEEGLNYENVVKHISKLQDWMQYGRGAMNMDTVPANKDYFITIKDATGNCTVVVRDKNKKVVKQILLTEWNKNASYYEGLYGPIPPPPPPLPLPGNEQWNKAAGVKDNGVPPVYYVDGNEITVEKMKEIEPNSIESVNVLKGESAIKKYGDKGKNGVVEIKTKKTSMEKALYVLDGKIITKKEMEALDPNQIESINVLKGEDATKKYGDKGKDGVIEISMKKVTANLKDLKIAGYATVSINENGDNHSKNEGKAIAITSNGYSEEEAVFLKKHPEVEAIGWVLISKVDEGQNRIKTEFPIKEGDYWLYLRYAGNAHDIFSVNYAEQKEKFKNKFGEDILSVPARVLKQAKEESK